jgi:hypothetical protein
VFAKLFNPDSTMVRLDQTEAERLRHVFAADRLLRRERAGWGDSWSARCQLVLKIRAASVCRSLASDRLTLARVPAVSRYIERRAGALTNLPPG